MSTVRKSVFTAWYNAMRDIEEELPEQALNALVRSVKSAHGQLEIPFTEPWAPEWGAAPATARQASERIFGVMNPALRAIAATLPESTYEDAYQDMVVGMYEAIETWDEKKGSAGAYLGSRAFYHSSQRARAELDMPAPVSRLGLDLERLEEQAPSDPLQALRGVNVVDFAGEVAPYTRPPWYQEVPGKIPTGGLPIFSLGRKFRLSVAGFEKLIPYFEQGIGSIQREEVYPISLSPQQDYTPGVQLRQFLQDVRKQTQGFLLGREPAELHRGSTIQDFEDLLTYRIDAEAPSWTDQVRAHTASHIGWSLSLGRSQFPEFGGRVGGLQSVQTPYDAPLIGRYSYVHTGREAPAEQRLLGLLGESTATTQARIMYALGIARGQHPRYVSGDPRQTREWQRAQVQLERMGHRQQFTYLLPDYGGVPAESQYLGGRIPVSETPLITPSALAIDPAITHPSPSATRLPFTVQPQEAPAGAPMKALMKPPGFTGAAGALVNALESSQSLFHVSVESWIKENSRAMGRLAGDRPLIDGKMQLALSVVWGQRSPQELQHTILHELGHAPEFLQGGKYATFMKQAFGDPDILDRFDPKERRWYEAMAESFTAYFQGEDIPEKQRLVIEALLAEEPELRNAMLSVANVDIKTLETMGERPVAGPAGRSVEIGVGDLPKYLQDPRNLPVWATDPGLRNWIQRGIPVVPPALWESVTPEAREALFAMRGTGNAEALAGVIEGYGLKASYEEAAVGAGVPGAFQDWNNESLKAQIKTREAQAAKAADSTRQTVDGARTVATDPAKATASTYAGSQEGQYGSAFRRPAGAPPPPTEGPPPVEPGTTLPDVDTTRPTRLPAGGAVSLEHWQGAIAHGREVLAATRPSSGGVAGYPAGDVYTDAPGEKILMKPEHIARARGLATQAFESVAGTPVPRGTAGSAVGTHADRAKQAFDNLTKKFVDTYVKEMEDSGQKLTPEMQEDVRHQARRIVGTGRDFLYRVERAMSDKLGGSRAGSRWKAERIGAAELEQMSQVPGFEALQTQIAQAGNVGTLAAGGGFIEGTGNLAGMDFRVPPTPPGGRPFQRDAAGGQQGGNLWRRMGAAGSALYGMYIARRFWGYTGDPAIQAMQEYQQLSYQWGPTTGAGMRPEGQAVQQRALAQYYEGLGAWQQFGGIAGAGRGFMATPAGGRLTATAEVAGGLGIVAQVLGGSLGPEMTQFLTMGATKGIPAIGMAGTYAAAGLLAFAGINEGLNAVLGQNMGMADRVGSSFQALGRFIYSGMSPEQQQAMFTQGAPGAEWLTKDFEAEAQAEGLTGLTKLSDKTGLAIDDPRLSEAAMVAMRITGQASDHPTTLRVAKMIASRMTEEGASASSIGTGILSYMSTKGARVGDINAARYAWDYTKLSPEARAEVDETSARHQQVMSMFRAIWPNMDYGDLSAFAGRMPSLGFAQRQYGYAARMETMGVSETVGQGWSSELMTMAPARSVSIMAGAETIGQYLTPAQFGAHTPAIRDFLQDMTMAQRTIWQGMAEGDPAAWSLQYRATGGAAGIPFMDAMGQPIYETSMAGMGTMAQRAAGQFGINPMLAGRITQAAQGGPVTGYHVAQALGLSQQGQEYFQQNPQAGMQDYRWAMQQRMGQLQMGSIGLQYQGILAQQQYLWGGGQWTGTPAPGSMWGMEDVMRGMQNQAQMAGFGSTLQRMDTGAMFARQQEAMGWERMQLQQQWQGYTMGFQRQGQLQRRGWAREDWQYQDTMRSLQFGWGMEDLDEAIRMSSGRQRRTLVKQRERMTLGQNLEETQIERQRARQEEMWAREDEMYQKQMEYIAHITEMDEDQFKMNVEQREELYEMDREELKRRLEEYKEQYALQTQIIDKQRQHQADELERQKAMLGIQMEIAQIQKELAEDEKKVKDSWRKDMAEFKDMGTLHRAEMVAKAISSMAKTLNGVNIFKIQQLEEMLLAADFD